VNRRAPRLAEEIREQVAALIPELKDPRIGFVTVTRVELATDLSLARVFVGVLGDESQRQKTLKGLRQAAGFVRQRLGRQLRAHKTPQFVFEYDTGLDATERVAYLLREVEAQRTAAEPPAQLPPDDDEPR
jgi:ribosome-binding factor A